MKHNRVCTNILTVLKMINLIIFSEMIKLNRATDNPNQIIPTMMKRKFHQDMSESKNIKIVF